MAAEEMSVDRITVNVVLDKMTVGRMSVDEMTLLPELTIVESK
jgi:hypothetical protein